MNMVDSKGEQSGVSDELKRLKKKAVKIEADVMKRNIYIRGVFEKLVELEEAIVDVAESTRSDFFRVIEDAGIEDPLKVLNTSIAHWDKMLASSEILPEGELIDQLRRDFQLDIRQAAEAFVPTDETESKQGEGAGSREKGDDVNRVSLALETLVHIELNGEKIMLDDLEVTVGKIPESSVRTRPYWIINLKNHKIAILLNNQYANRTFVLGYRSKSELESLSGSTKEQLKDLAEKDPRIHHFIYVGPAEFKGELAASVQKVFEGLEMTKPYATYEEARAATKALGIKSWLQYVRRRKEDPRLPYSPQYYTHDYRGFAEFFGTNNLRKSAEQLSQEYSTYEEASAAAKILGITSHHQYRREYKKDPRLPSVPRIKYGKAFLSWGDFLGTGFTVHFERNVEAFSTYEEASEAAKALGIQSESEYRIQYKKDPRLPSKPDRHYKKDFTSWGEFLGTGSAVKSLEKRMQMYQTYGEASAAARDLKISSAQEYQRKYKQDSRLPSNPQIKYGEAFVSWVDFLGKEKAHTKEHLKDFYHTYEEAAAAARALGIFSYEDYRKRYKEDPRLPSVPEVQYREAFVSWADFLGSD